MNTTNFITASAEITTITSLKKGDVYKRLEESSYGGDEIVQGIVLDVLYNGTDAAIQVMEFKPGYKDIDKTFKVFGGAKDIKIFPSSKEEIEHYLNDSVRNMQDEIVKKESELLQAKDNLAKTQEIVNGTLIKSLTTPDFTNQGQLAE